MIQSKPAEYPFHGAAEEREYCVFSDELENDPLIAFHGTALTNLNPILENGFAFIRDLQSLSFAKRSSLALKYASEARTPDSPDGCILVVRFKSLEVSGIAVEHSIIHVHMLDEQPTVIGFCIIPSNYRFV
jgi:hypothetical protein